MHAVKLAASAALFSLACSGPAKPAATSPATPAPAAPQLAPDAGAVEHNAAAPGHRKPGIPHLTAIERVVLSPEGDSAITRDSAGHLRFWASLDGEAEPQPIPLNGASHFALARNPRTRTWTLALVDTAGAAHLLKVHRNLTVERIYDLPPKLNVVDVEVLPGGERVALLRSDRVIELRDLDGKLLASHDRRGFRPARLRLANRNTLIALELEPGTSESTVAVHRLRIRDKAGAVKLVEDGDAEVTVKSFAVGAHQSGASPSAKLFAFVALDKQSNWEAVIVDLDAGSHRAESMKSIPRHQTPALGFVSENQLVARGGANGATWMFDLANEAQRPLSVRPDTQANAPRAFAANLLVAGLGNWLYVYRVDTRRSLYLGYEAFSPMGAAVSPDGRAFAWGSGADLFVTAPSGERLAHRELLRGQSVRHIAFVDDSRILIAYYTAAIELYDWKTGKIVDAVDDGGSFTAGGYDAGREMFWAIPQRGQVWITRVSSKGLEGPYVVADGAYNAGFLDGDNLLWTVDSGNRLRFYTEGELKAGVSSDAIASRGVTLPVRPVAIGRDGRIYATVYSAGRNSLTVYAAPDMPEPAPVGSKPNLNRIDLSKKQLAQVPTISGVNMSAVAPAGDRVAVVSNNVVFVRDADLKVVWSYPFPNGVRSLTWNAGGTHLSVATQEAAVVFAADDGKPVTTDCGPMFTARATPPANLFPPNVHASVCERL